MQELNRSFYFETASRNNINTNKSFAFSVSPQDQLRAMQILPID
ncbi:hypothetical protein BH10CYA1_BH10CYA1_55800 [soil metagenome]